MGQENNQERKWKKRYLRESTRRYAAASKENQKRQVEFEREDNVCLFNCGGGL